MTLSWNKRAKSLTNPRAAGDSKSSAATVENIMPKRLTRPRRKGVKTPQGARYVGKPTLFGNPFAMPRFGHAKSVILHRAWLIGDVSDYMLERMGFCPKQIEALGRLRARILTNLHHLDGLDLTCWCPQNSKWCHADILLELAPIYAEYERLAA
jgi:hypothetical protein